MSMPGYDSSNSQKELWHGQHDSDQPATADIWNELLQKQGSSHQSNARTKQHNKLQLNLGLPLSQKYTKKYYNRGLAPKAENTTP